MQDWPGYWRDTKQSPPFFSTPSLRATISIVPTTTIKASLHPISSTTPTHIIGAVGIGHGPELFWLLIQLGGFCVDFVVKELKAHPGGVEGNDAQSNEPSKLNEESTSSTNWNYTKVHCNKPRFHLTRGCNISWFHPTFSVWKLFTRQADPENWF